MTDLPPRSSQTLDPETRAQLLAELKSPYRGLRQFVYLACGASGCIGAFIFLTQLLAGRASAETALPNLALQVGIVVLMVSLFRWEQRTQRRKNNKKK
ncbi:DUF3493 domain-containing protein [Thermocoleostomius sinensis]|jgi:hypothetical protein|uniref:DUF3493 domain-containing protein n=1 Tax=Thermocoleostomius sinensis A174 TaxID=2016057 RepID=A0A9E9CB33_9CYAN|nr:DUF3493 domain-containing protein [Thermocoleostomius sinensis]WAL59735.1 DUF3493 domain-containing protein [Thermocoleostomius sinensis A174]